MITCTVHEPADPPADRLDRAEHLAFVRDGFRWSAFVFTPVWLLAKRLWLPFFGFIALAALLAAGMQALAIDARWGTFLALAIQAVIGFEAATLVRWGLERRGWRTLGSVTGRNLAECERRFFTAWLAGQPAVAMTKPEAASPSRWFRRLTPWAGLASRRP